MTPKRIVPVVTGAVVVLAVAAYLVIRHNHSNGVLMASGSVEATEAALGFQVPGRIDWVGPHEGDRVRAGDTLAGIAYAEYGNPNLWRAVAELNNIDDPMRLRPGQRLMLPTVETLDSLQGPAADPRNVEAREAAHAAR